MAAYDWWTLAHLVSVAFFLLAHGPPVFVALRLGKERDAARVRALVDLSWLCVGLTHMAMFAILITGLGLAFLGGWWRAAWLWTALVLFIATWTAMFAWGTRHIDRVRAAVGTRLFYPKKGAPPPPTLSPEELERLLASRHPLMLAVAGSAVLLAFFWIMLAKPF